MYNHNKAQQSKNRVHISWDILYNFSCNHDVHRPVVWVIIYGTFSEYAISAVDTVLLLRSLSSNIILLSKKRFVIVRKLQKYKYRVNKIGEYLRCAYQLYLPHP